MPKLYITEDGQEDVYEIFEEEVSLGRGAANAIQIADSHASKVHAVIRRLQDHWKLVDLESKNGTRINGEFHNQHWLADGDTVTIGTAVLRYAAEGAAQGAPSASAATPAVRPRAVPARPATPAARPAAARPAVPAVPASPPAVPATPAAPPAAPAAPARPSARGAPVRRGPSSAPRRRRPGRDDSYDDEYGDEDQRRRPRRRSNSSIIVVLGILGAAAFGIIMFAMFGGGPSLNQKVYRQAAAYADAREYERALRYAEQNADPAGEHYWRVLAGMTDWKKKIRAQKDLERGQEARDYFDRQIYRQQAITPNFHAKDALRDSEVVKLLRDFLRDYKGSATAEELMHSEHSGYPALREAMREYADPELKATAVLGGMQAQIGIDLSAGRFGKVVQDFEYARDMNRLCMTPENWNELRRAVDLKIEEVTVQARTAYQAQRREFDAFIRAEERSQALALLARMREAFNGIPELTREIRALEERY